MKKYLIIDSRMRKQEQEFLKSLGYYLIYTNLSDNVYSEISSHVDIFCCKIGDNLILEPNFFNTFINLAEYGDIKKRFNVISGSSDITKNITVYNACVLGDFLISSIKNTDKNILIEAQKLNLKIINVNQRYAKCSISVANCNNIITLDNSIDKYNNENKISNMHINMIYLPQHDFNIKLLNSFGKYSFMYGFLGGATCVIDNKYIIFGDINNIKNQSRDKLINFVNKCGLELIDFKGLDIIDYGGVIEI